MSLDDCEQTHLVGKHVGVYDELCQLQVAEISAHMKLI